MKKITFLLTFFLFASRLFAQNQELTLEEAVLQQFRKFYPETLFYLQFRDNDRFTFCEKGASVLYENSVSKDKKTELLKLEELNLALTSQNLENVTYFPEHSWQNSDILRFCENNTLFSLNVNTKKIENFVSLPKEAENLDVEPKTFAVAYTIDNNIYIGNKNFDKIAITNFTDKGIVCGKYVSRNEFGCVKGTFWSPNGNFLAFYYKDERNVAEYPLVDATQAPMAFENKLRYPMAGEKSEHLAVGIYNVQTKKVIYIEKDSTSEKYLTNISWHPSEKYLFIAVLNRQQNHLQFNQYEISTGKLVKTLFEEKNERYVEPLKSAICLKTQEQFIWLSQRDGFTHIYLYQTDGKLVKQLTKGNFVVTEILGFDEKEENLFYYSTAENPLETNLFRVNLKTSEIKRLSQEKGTHNVAVSSDKNHFIDVFSNQKVPNQILLLDKEGKTKRNLLTAANPLKNYKLAEMTVGTIKADDNKTDLYYRLYKPLNFVEGKKYPAIIYVYGGPHAQMINESWLADARMWEFYMAQKNYVVLVVDNRGSERRGFEFESCIHRQCGVTEMKDQLKGVEFLKNLSYVDMNRIGVHGWSYGGFMTISLLTTYPDIFKVGVSGGPVIDWKFYEVMYGERYMDSPQENPEGYEKTSLLNKVSNLKGKLLIVHGGLDNTVLWKHSLEFMQKCIEKGVLIDYFAYPRHEHNVRGQDRLHLMKLVTQYFDEHL